MRWVAGGVLILLAVGVVWVYWPGDTLTTVEADPSPTPSPPIPTNTSPEPGLEEPEESQALPDWAVEAADQLVEKHWEREAAEKVIAFHVDWLAILKENDQKQYETTLRRLGQLRNPGRLTSVLVNHPELAGLLTTVDDPVVLASVLSGKNGELITGLFVAHLEQDNLRKLAAVLNPVTVDLIVALMKRGIVGSETIFITAREGSGGADAEDAYLKWVRSSLDDVLRGSDRELEETFLFILAEGAAIREKFASLPFRARFPDRWVALKKMVEQLRNEQARKLPSQTPNAEETLPALTDLIGMPGIWEFLERPEAERLFRARGVLAIDLLNGNSAYPALLQAKVIDLLCNGDDRVAKLLLDYRGVPGFHSFLEQPVSPGLLSDVASDLNAHGEPLKRFAVLRDKLRQSIDALRAAVEKRDAGVVEFLPLYSVYRVYQAYSDGEEVTNADLLVAGVDLVTTLAPAGKAGVALAKAGLKQTGKDVAKNALRTEGQKIVLQRLAGQAVKGVGEVAATRTALWLAVRNACRKSAEVVRSVIGKASTAKVGVMLKVDVTGPVRFAFTHTKFGRSAFKVLTGLEARLFMRSDAQIVLKLHWRITGKQVRNWMAGYLIHVCGHYLEEHEEIPKEVADRLPPPEKWNDRKAWKKAAGVLFLAALADLLPMGE